mgnify:CR=1 FL=1|tara:strand:- start:28863 stop:29972 length:1110 start_codon:yes stop_codon:yes gene_type:complete
MSEKFRILTVVGARPQFIKAAAVSRRLTAPQFAGVEEVLVHTGQHYDDNMSGAFFAELSIPEPAINLGIGSSGHAQQTGRTMEAIEPIVADVAPDLILVYGDTNSTLAAALVAAKAPVPLAHVEAGLRSYRTGMPEEVNRVVTDRLSELLFCPTERAVTNLKSEGRTDDVHLVGDVMFDVFCFAADKADVSALPHGIAPGGYVLATMHRQENTDDPARLQAIASALDAIAVDLPVVLPLHPRTRAALERSGCALHKIVPIDPQPYGSMMALLRNAALMVTDSGGLQKEAFFARTPCVTLRDETEWIETLEVGWNRLASPADGKDHLVAALRGALEMPPRGEPPAFYGDGDAAGHILERILLHFGQASAS